MKRAKRDRRIKKKSRRVAARRYSFKELMAGVTKDNIHGEIKTGPAVGKEPGSDYCCFT
jgi:hypothetical protein